MSQQAAVDGPSEVACDPGQPAVLGACQFLVRGGLSSLAKAFAPLPHFRAAIHQVPIRLDINPLLPRCRLDQVLLVGQHILWDESALLAFFHDDGQDCPQELLGLMAPPGHQLRVVAHPLHAILVQEEAVELGLNQLRVDAGGRRRRDGVGHDYRLQYFPDLRGHEDVRWNLQGEGDVLGVVAQGRDVLTPEYQGNDDVRACPYYQLPTVPSRDVARQVHPFGADIVAEDVELGLLLHEVRLVLGRDPSDVVPLDDAELLHGHDAVHMERQDDAGFFLEPLAGL
mmetsp:Transcript_75045/g.210565  ORF Transcript_75045/g.210565 Transcript_75045/m.210565 type:complete len:284 (-) Transcript_75045:443-1294(-)